MPIPRQIFLFLLTETISGKSYTLDAAGSLQLTNQPTWLEQSPDGWRETTISFGRSAKYYGINRSFTTPLKFVGTGAAIIRKLLYQGRGLESALALIILKWNDQNDTYELYYKSGVDLTKVEDLSGEGIRMNLLESGLLQSLKIGENTVREFPR